MADLEPLVLRVNVVDADGPHQVLISAFCPKCGNRRTPPATQAVGGWNNPCGHPDTAAAVMAEVEAQCQRPSCVLLASADDYPYCSSVCADRDGLFAELAHHHGFIAALGQRLHDAVAAVSARAIARIQVEQPHGRRVGRALEEHHAVVSETFRRVAQALQSGTDPELVEFSPAATQVAAWAVQRGMPMTEFTRSHRLCQEVLFSWIFAEINAGAAAADQAPLSQLLTRWVHAYVDSALLRLEHLYDELAAEGGSAQP